MVTCADLTNRLAAKETLSAMDGTETHGRVRSETLDDVLQRRRGELDGSILTEMRLGGSILSERCTGWQYPIEEVNWVAVSYQRGELDGRILSER